MKFLAFTFIGLLLLPASLKADVLNEGWYKVSSANVHIGYYLARYEYNPKTRQFISKSFLKTNKAGGDITESLVAYSDEGMKPISYQYTSLTAGVVKTIDAKFSKGTASLTINDKGKTTTTTKKMAKGSFLSAHLPLMLIKNGVAVGKNMAYKGVAEEDGETYNGKAYIKEIKKLGNKDLFRILNDFKGTKFVSLMDKNGQIIATKAPLLGITTNLQANQQAAAGNIPVPKKSIQKIFGKIP